MLNDPDAIRVAHAVEACFAAIARCEQDLHAIRRSDHGKGMTGKCDRESAEALLDALKADHGMIDVEIEKILPTVDSLLAAPGMSAGELLAALGEITEPCSAYSPEPKALAHRLAPLIARAQLIDAWLEPTFNL